MVQTRQCSEAIPGGGRGTLGKGMPVTGTGLRPPLCKAVICPSGLLPQATVVFKIKFQEPKRVEGTWVKVFACLELLSYVPSNI